MPSTSAWHGRVPKGMAKAKTAKTARARTEGTGAPATATTEAAVAVLAVPASWGILLAGLSTEAKRCNEADMIEMISMHHAAMPADMTTAPRVATMRRGAMILATMHLGGQITDLEVEDGRSSVTIVDMREMIEVVMTGTSEVLTEVLTEVATEVPIGMIDPTIGRRGMRGSEIVTTTIDGTE